ncbi:MAG: hypothetical protein IE889_04240 [Campylobacterales bacterium]|nr:hypothetical protein [Campylobacterales bacterium]
MENKNEALEFEKEMHSDNMVLEAGTQESADGVLEEEEEPIKVTPVVKKQLSRNEEAKELIKSAEALVNQADKEVNNVKEVVSKNVYKFEEAKANILNTTMVHNMILLERANFEHHKEVMGEPFEISLESMPDHFSLAKITSGRFSGFLLAILGIIVTVVAWILAASSQTGVAVSPEKVPDDASLNTLMTWIGGGMTGGVGNPELGMITLITTALLVGWAIYKFRVAMRETRNFRVAHEAFEKSHSYVDNQKEVKSEMERMNEHLKAAVTIINDYKILLDEQNAKLQRILHIEGQLDEFDAYHYTSQAVMQDSEKLMNRMENLLSTPVTKEGRLNEASEYALIEAKALYESYVSWLYNS